MIPIEIKENFKKLEELFLTLDRNIVDGIQDSSLIHSIFRTAHSLKSSLKMAEMASYATVIHEMETVFDRVRSGQLVPDRVLVDCSLKAIDFISSGLSPKQSLQTDCNPYIEAFHAIKKTENVKEDRSGDWVLNKRQSIKALKCWQTGYSFYIVEKFMTHQTQQDFLRLPFLEDIKEMGVFISMNPPLGNMPYEKDEFVVKFLIATSLPADEVEFYIFDPFYSIDYSELDISVSNDMSQGFLVVEDDLTSRFYLKKLLESKGVCDTAVNGNEGVELFKANYGSLQEYTIIFLDIMMPELDGHGVLKEIRRIEQIFGDWAENQTSIIMTTALDDTENVINAFDSMCQGYLVKPISKDSLYTLIEKINPVN